MTIFNAHNIIIAIIFFPKHFKQHACTFSIPGVEVKLSFETGHAHLSNKSIITLMPNFGSLTWKPVCNKTKPYVTVCQTWVTLHFVALHYIKHYIAFKNVA